MSQTEQFYEVRVEHNVPVPMRDGTVLRADVYCPKAEGRWPVIVGRDGYDGQTEEVSKGTFFSQRGYVYVHNNTRGTYQSEGVFFPFVDDAWGENQDGYDTIEWAAHQSWSDGNVGMYGTSYTAFTQYVTAPTRPPSLKACIPIFGSSAKEIAFQNGAYRLREHRGWAISMALRCLQGLRTGEDKARIRARLENAKEELDHWLWHLPLRDLPPLEDLSPWYFEHLSRLTDASWWNRTDAKTKSSEVDVPMLHVGGWYDLYLAGTLDHYSGLAAHVRSDNGRRHQRLLVGPWDHGDAPPKELDFGDEALLNYQESDMALRWFDCWLKGKNNGVPDEPPVRIFLMGENRWLAMDQWPPADGTYKPMFLRHGTDKTEHSLNNGQLTFERPGSGELSDRYDYDPQNPIPTSPVYQHELEERLLTYTSELLEEPVVVIGPVKAVIYASSSAPDTDWVVRLCDVWPDGRSVKICDGILRARFRNSLEQEELMEPGQVYQFEIDMVATAQTFLAGHRIRVHVTSSDFPRYDRNLNTGGPFGEEIEGQVAVNTIYHDATRPSHVVLPIMKLIQS